MVIFHAYYSAKNIFGVQNYFFSDSVWFYIGKTSALLFISVAWLSFYIAERKYWEKIIQKYWKVIVQLWMISAIISLWTFVFMPEQFIVWGILHFFALSFLLLLMFRKLGYYNFFIIVLCFGLWYLAEDSVSNSYFFVFGFVSNSFASADYYPLFPYFGVMLLGYC